MSSLPSQNEIKEKRPADDKQRMRWFLAFFLVFCTLISIIVPSIAFFATKSVLSLPLFSALLPVIIYLCRRFATFLLPISEEEKDHQLKMKELELKMKMVDLQRINYIKLLGILKKHKVVLPDNQISSLEVKHSLEEYEKSMIVEGLDNE